MSATYFAILTAAGEAKLANATALGVPLKITQMGVGDGNGNQITPSPAQTQLVHEVRKAALNTLFQDPVNSAQIVAEQVIPETEGGWWIRELGLYDETGTLIAVANCPATYKPQLAEGSGRTQVIRMVLIVSSTTAVELKIDPSVVLATRKYVDDSLAAAIEAAINQLDGKQSARVGTTANITLAGLQTIDGILLVTGDRVLVKNQTTAKDNGIYIAAEGTWSRAPDADASIEVTPGLFVSVENGTANADSVWQLVTDAPITLGSTALAFEMAAGRTGAAAGTYRSITVNARGQVTGGTNPTTLAGYGITDAASIANVQKSAYFVAAAAGTADAITATFSPAITALTNGLILCVRATAINTTTTPTFTPDSGSITGKTIVKGAGTALVVGDIAGAGHWLELQYDSTLDKWMLLNPATGVASLPAGAVIHVARSTPPAGYLKANGALVSRTTYAALFAAIGTTFGVGDDSTTFALPDLRGEFIRGWDDGRGVDIERAMGNAQSGAVERHNHMLPTGASSGSNSSGIWGVGDQYWQEVGSINFETVANETAVSGSVGNAAYAGAIAGTFAGETRPRNIAMLACIKH